ncbi:helicase-associated domain-containing protein [Dactylosporangium sp. AC04546]|uniref:helicase-associated domain-containing protein n=1 Tax=Dactylosporangium sp. AC04546 TaxID=2862460 RepID=UPI001EDCF01F|nr:helicase-associated domain-containing protein [Dactylosporangium sp. AC04546]WVK84993.1 helicase-associated domain-containing protein [Dactylosporangium sp. AC04546]
MKSLLEHLEGLPASRLARLAGLHELERAEPAWLAGRLVEFDSIVRALTVQPLPSLQVAEVLALRAAGTRRRDLAAALGVGPADAGLDAALAALEEWGLVWPDDGDWLRYVPLYEVIAGGFGFAPSVVTGLGAVPTGHLQRIAYELGAPVGRTQRELVTGIAAALADADVVRAQFAEAPEEARELLRDLSGTDPYWYDPRHMAALRNGRRTPLRWAVDHGLVAWNPIAGGAAMLPSEVGVVLREDFTAPFDPAPPLLAPVEVSTAMVERDGAAAARAALAAITAVLEECGRSPVPMLKNGGVGVRELRRLAKAVGGTDLELRLWLTLAGLSGLLGLAGDRVAPSPEFDVWLKMEPALQYRRILDCWFGMHAAPLLATDTPALVRSQREEGAALARHAVVGLLGSLPDGLGVASADVIGAFLMFARPLIVTEPDQALATAVTLWREAELLGVGAHLAPTAICRALLADGGADGLTEVLARYLPAAEQTVVLQGDLTAVATGTPSAALTEFLDLAADRESRGGASTWRFSAASVRRAFDAGRSADELLAALEEAATGGRVPQPLRYLVSDVARRHGGVRVRAVGCVIHSEDTTLLDEILRVKSLVRLELRALAPTVLTSALPPDETLVALRAAGYAPAREHPDGSIAVELVTRFRAASQ